MLMHCVMLQQRNELTPMKFMYFSDDAIGFDAERDEELFDPFPDPLLALLCLLFGRVTLCVRYT